MIISIALPSNVSFLEKDNLVGKANGSHLGIFVSDLPQNHDLFQLLSIWKVRYPNIPIFGTAIISPFIYEFQFLKKQIKTIFEVFENGIELGFGLGDKNLLPTDIKNRITSFQEIMNQLLDDSHIQSKSDYISIAGAGKRLIDYAGTNNLGLIYNGIISSEVLASIKAEKTREKVSSYVMVDVNDYNSLSHGFISIVSRIITGLSNTELKRLRIDLNEVEIIRTNLQQKNLTNYKIWLPEHVIQKVAFFGTDEEILERIHKFEQFEINQIILSIVGKTKKIEFMEYLKRENT